MKTGSDRAFADLRRMQRLQRRIARVSKALKAVREMLPAIPFADDHAKADRVCDRVANQLRELEHVMYDVKDELRSAFVEALSDENDLIVREYEAQQERTAIADEPSAVADDELDDFLSELARPAFGATVDQVRAAHPNGHRQA